MKILIALVVVCLGSAAFWASFDHPLPAPDWSGKLGGISYNPSGLYDKASFDQPVPETVIRGDMKQLATVTNRIRTYSVDRGLDRVPYVAKEFGLKVTLGIWLSDDRLLNEAELARGIEVIRDNPDTVDRVIVGNEAVLRGELTASDVVAYMHRVRNAIANPNIEVGTADVWSVWLKYPTLAQGSAFVGIHLLPYWEGIAANQSMGYVADRYAMIKKAFPDKKIVIAETGWPSEGRVKKGSVPSESMEAFFIRKFLKLAASNNYDYYIIEAYDQPWKAEQEGAVGAFWGLFNADRTPKFEMTGGLSSFPQWPTFATSAALGILAVGASVLASIPAVALSGYLLLGGIVGFVVSGVVFIIDALSLRYVDWGTVGGAMVVMPAVLFTAVVLLTETAEWALSLWRVRRKSLPTVDFGGTPRVSIHVPIHNEPPQMVIGTLDALARLDYPDFEVIVLDNNTASESDWRPVEAHCEALGPRFRFFHFDGMKGFKAGALNKALELTDPAAAFIGVIDSDYQVSPDWLKTVVPAFGDPQVALVQAPQDYRDAERESAEEVLLRGVSRFLPRRHGGARRTQRDHPARHDVYGSSHRASGSGWLGTVVHHRRHRTRSASVRGRLCRALHVEVARSRSDARHVRRIQGPALSLGVRCDADSETPRSDAVRSRRQADARAALSLRCRLAAVVCRRVRVDLLRTRGHLDRPDGRCTEVLRRTVNRVVVDGACVVPDQDHQDDRAAPGEGRRRNSRVDRIRGHGPVARIHCRHAAFCSDW